MRNIYFVSSSKEKYEEIKEIVANQGTGWTINWKKASLMEIQEDDEKKLIKKKALEAFKLLKRPVLVEHTALKLNALQGLPGLHTDYFYSKLGYEWIVNYCKSQGDFGASAESVFCLCDGKKYYVGQGEEEGEVIRDTKGIDTSSAFGWDIIFIPKLNNPNHKTYACMEGKKNRRSMRKLAWENLLKKNEEKLVLWDELQIDENVEELAKLIAAKKVALFVGAGISASINFPSWKELIGELGKKLGYEPELFESYGNYMMLAEYAELCGQKEPDSGEKLEMYRQLCDTFQLTEDVKGALNSSRIYELLLKLDFPVIYTTNYDSLLEEYYKQQKSGAVVIKNIGDMQDIKPGVPRIMKFHGDLAYKDSIVLAESKYFERMNFENFMDVQLQADMLQYSMLFLGYSLSDVNVKLLMYLARKRCSNAGMQEGKDSGLEHDQAIKSYIYTATPNAVQKEVFEKNHIITFSGTNVDKKEGTTEFLEKLLKECEKLRQVSEPV